MDWIISANSEKYDHKRSFEENNGIIHWRQNQNKFAIGDIIYIYCAKPYQKIMYKCEVVKTKLKLHEFKDTNKYWIDRAAYNKTKDGLYFKIRLIEHLNSERTNLENLRNHGLMGNPQGRQKINKIELLNYIEESFTVNSYFPETIPDTDYYEGLKTTVTVNKYERSSLARRKCIEFHGARCKICKMNFLEVYGAIGQDYIHVHHVKPISQIGKEYKINYKTDLIPVCPNCHAMLHRKVDGKEISIEQLKKKFSHKKV